MAESLIKTRIEGELAYVGLNRPDKANAINHELLRAIPDAIMEVDRPEVRAIILYGEGAVFSAGIDFTSLSGAGGEPSGGRINLARFRHFVAEAQLSLNRIEAIE